MNFDRCMRIFRTKNIEIFTKTRDVFIQLLDEEEDSIVVKFHIQFYKSDYERTPSGRPNEVHTLEINTEIFKEVDSMQSFEKLLTLELEKELEKRK